MDKLLGVIGVGAAFLAGYTNAIAFEPEGSDIQLILGAVYALVAVVALIGVGILARLHEVKNSNKEPSQ